MGDPLSVAASVAGLLSLGIQVTQSLVSFYTSYKYRDSNLASMIESLEGILDIFQSLKNTLSNRKFQADERGLIKRIESSIEDCDEVICELRDECDKFNKTTDGFKGAVKVIGRKAAYPFKRSTLQKLDEDIGEIRANLSFALAVLQLKDNERTQDDIADIKQLLDLVKTSQTSADLRDWLKAPDATINHNAACAKRHPGTGMWLVKSSTFEMWLSQGNSFLWLNGFAGCGKSVLCSTAIQYAFRHRRSDPRIGIAFFYFTFNDESKQDESTMLRALLLQLSSQLHDGHIDLRLLYDSYRTGTPPSPVLADCLLRLIMRFEHVYILLDALDESPRNQARGRVLEILESVIQNRSLKGLHLLVTSRDEQDIRDSLNPSPDQQINMRNAEIDKDIAKFISYRLDEDRKLRKWSPYHSKIKTSLTERAKGVYVIFDYTMKNVRKRTKLTTQQI